MYVYYCEVIPRSRHIMRCNRRMKSRRFFSTCHPKSCKFNPYSQSCLRTDMSYFEKQSSRRLLSTDEKHTSDRLIYIILWLCMFSHSLIFNRSPMYKTWIYSRSRCMPGFLSFSLCWISLVNQSVAHFTVNHAPQQRKSVKLLVKSFCWISVAYLVIHFLYHFTIQLGSTVFDSSSIDKPRM